MKNPKDTLTSIAAIVLVVLQVVQIIYEAAMGYINSVEDVNWTQLIIVIVIAVIGYFTGKNFNGTKKVAPTVQ